MGVYSAAVAALAPLLIGLVAGEDLRNVRINFGSCNDGNKTQMLWPFIQAREPDLWIWGGDNIYGDDRPRSFKQVKEWAQGRENPVKDWLDKKFFEQATPEKLKWLYDKQLKHPGYSAFVESIGQENIIGTWDDHDMGLNDAGNDYEFRAESQQAFLDFLHVGPDDERRTREGVYSFRDINNGLVRIITLDTRYFRDSYEKRDGDVLGAAQWTWLEETLETSPAQFNLLVSGVQVLPDQPIRTFAENWFKLPVAYNRLMKLVTETRAKGIVFLSGDVHYAEMFQTNCTCANDKSFVLAEHTSSGMTHSWARYGHPATWLVQSAYLTQPFYTTIPGSLYLDINFGELDFAGLGSDAASLTARILDEHGEQVYEHVWHSSDLKGEYRGEACECIPIQGRNVGDFEESARHTLFAFVFLSPLIAIVLPIISLVCFFCGCCTTKSNLKQKSD